MRQFQAIPVYPLRMRGRFGLAGHIYRHGFWSMALYTFLYVLAVGLLFVIAALPCAVVCWRSGVFTRLAAYLHELSALSSLPDDLSSLFGMAARLFGPLSTAEQLVAVFGSLGLGLVCWGVFGFYLKPLYLGVAYNEMSGRVFGAQGNVGELCKRGGPCLRRYYTTYLARMVGRIGASAVGALAAQVVNALVMLSAMLATLLSGGFAIGLFALLLLVSTGVKLVMEVFLVCVYPVAVNEQSKGFSALGQSLRLGFLHFGRFLGALVLRTLLLWAFLLPALILLCIGALSDLPLPLLACAVCYRFLVRMLYTPYRIGFDTVLYFDARAREPHAAPPPVPPVPSEATPEAIAMPPVTEAPGPDEPTPATDENPAMDEDPAASADEPAQTEEEQQ